MKGLIKNNGAPLDSTPLLRPPLEKSWSMQLIRFDFFAPDLVRKATRKWLGEIGSKKTKFDWKTTHLIFANHQTIIFRTRRCGLSNYIFRYDGRQVHSWKIHFCGQKSRSIEEPTRNEKKNLLGLELCSTKDGPKFRDKASAHCLEEKRSKHVVSLDNWD